MQAITRDAIQVPRDEDWEYPAEVAYLATRATPEEIQNVINDTETKARWVRLMDGTLVLALVPSADIYESVTQSPYWPRM